MRPAMRSGSRRARLLIGAGVFLLLLAVGVSFVFVQRGARTPDVAAADTTLRAGADSTRVDAPGKAGKGDRKKSKKNGKEEVEAKPVPVETALAGARDLPAFFNATGSLEARRQVDLIAKAQGQIVALNVEEGDVVEAGDILLEIEHREEQILLEKAKVQADAAQKELARNQGLTERGLGSESDHEAKSRLAETAVLDRDLAQVRLDEKIVRAPFAGLITRRQVEKGQTVTPGQPLFAIADISPLEVRLFLPEQVVRALRVGQPVEIRSDVAPDALIVGTVERIAPAVDPATSTVKVTLRVDNPARNLRVGSFVRGRITTDVHEGVVSVPRKALVPEAGSAYLFVAEADTVRKVPVETGYADDSFIEITRGLEPDQRIITVGQGGLRHGSRIKDLSAEPKTESAARDSAANPASPPLAQGQTGSGQGN